jgi:hypothetical protein
VETQAEERGQGRMSRNFWENIPIDCVKAIAELKRLKVYKLCAWDYEETFSDVWWLVLHEVDMYAEGEFVREASRSYFHTGDPEAMNLKQAQRADSWLLKWKHLFEKYTNPVYYSDVYYSVHSGFSDFSDSSYHYDGQVI